jgi:alpha-mannosidase
VSLLRAPTWPDPGADNGFQRLRLALMPCGEGWRQAQVPLQARRLREPLWCHPVDPAVADLPLPAWPPLAPDLALVSLRASADGSGDLVVALQNEGPCRRRFDPGPGWVLLARLDGLDADVVPDIVPDIAPEIVQAADAGGATPAQLSAEGSALVRPWELCFWRLGRR